MTYKNTYNEILHQLTDGAPLVSPIETIAQAPDVPGLYAIFVDAAESLPAPFGKLLAKRDTTLIYLGKAGDSLRKRLGEEDLRHKRAATFFRSLGAVLGYWPPEGSLANAKNQDNYRFSPQDTTAIAAWIDAHLRVRWLILPKAETEAFETQLIGQLCPLLNLKDNPKALPELRALRQTCKQIATQAQPQAKAAPPPLPHGLYLSTGLGWGGTRAMYVGTPTTPAAIHRLTGALRSGGADQSGEPIPVSEPFSRAWLRAIEEAEPIPPTSRHAYRFYAGCLLGIAVGDALGALAKTTPITVLRQYDGANDSDRPAQGWLQPTWYTQLCLFTAEGLMRAYTRGAAKGMGGGAPGCLRHAYIRWLSTQSTQQVTLPGGDLDGWLITERARFTNREPSATVLAALQSGEGGSPDRPINTSKGCGAIPRGAVIGLAEQGVGFKPFELGQFDAAITHGHHNAQLASGTLAALIAALMRGASLDQAIQDAMADLARGQNHAEVKDALHTAVTLAKSGQPPQACITKLGSGYIAEEALAIGLFCAIRAESFADGLLLAIAHAGERRATGAITGAILGARMGMGAIPGQWLAYLELRPLIADLTRDLFCHFGQFVGSHYVTSDWERYPGW
jgi:ADP-ribosyl-[dinitrogen reductase] hydrolase